MQASSTSTHMTARDVMSRLDHQYKVYRYTFDEDGAVYYGVTRQHDRTRRKSWYNIELRNRLNRCRQRLVVDNLTSIGESGYSYTVIDRFKTKAEAHRLELELINQHLRSRPNVPLLNRKGVSC